MYNLYCTEYGTQFKTLVFLNELLKYNRHYHSLDTCWLPTIAAEVWYQLGHTGFVMEKVVLRQFFCK
jgi:hypothetical protein